jgi:deazaflavin-dependent oxidoreductase (nitroreductase family)
MSASGQETDRVLATNAEPTRRGPEYVDGRYVAERRANALVQTPRGGRILSASMLPWFKLRPPKGFGVLTTTGRRTGKRRSRCVRAIRRDDKVFLVAIGGEFSAWVKNVRANPGVRLRIRGGTFSGTTRELRDATEREEAVAAFCGTVMPFDYFECRAHRVGRPTRAKIQELHRTWFEGGVPLVVELDA